MSESSMFSTIPGGLSQVIDEEGGQLNENILT